MTDVAPFTLGIETMVQYGEDTGSRMNGIFMPIIERNTVIPASRSKVVTTVEDNQRGMSVRVFQGEARQVKDNVQLGEFTLKLPPAPAGAETVDVRFTYDSSGLLEVRATAESTGRVETLVIEGNPGLMTPEEVAQRLAALDKLKQHPRDDTENRALIARAERLYEERLGDERNAIGRAVGVFVAALDRQKPDEIRETRRNLTLLLDSIDHSYFH